MLELATLVCEAANVKPSTFWAKFSADHNFDMRNEPVLCHDKDY